MKKKTVSILLVISMVLQLCCGAAFATEPVDEVTSLSGTCGENLTWMLDREGVLTISGSGAMANYNMYDNFAPWVKVGSEVKQVVFAKGSEITHIGEHAFANCTKLTEIEIPDSVTQIGYGAFYGCEKLGSATLPDGLKTIGGMAFVDCSALTEITIPASVTDIGERAFAFGGMKTVKVLGSEPELGYGVFDGCTITTHAPWISHVSDQWGTIVSTNSVIQNVICKIFDPISNTKNGKTALKQGDSTKITTFTAFAAQENETEVTSGHMLFWTYDSQVDHYLAYQGSTEVSKIENAKFQEPPEDFPWCGWIIPGTDLDPDQSYTIKAFDADGNLLDIETLSPEKETTPPQVSDFTGTINLDGSVHLAWSEAEGDTMLALWFLDDDRDSYLTFDMDKEASDTLVDMSNVYGTECSYTLGTDYTEILSAGTKLSMLIIDLCGNEEIYTCTLKEPEITKLTVSDTGLIEIKAENIYNDYFWFDLSCTSDNDEDFWFSFGSFDDGLMETFENGVYTASYQWDDFEDLPLGTYTISLMFCDGATEQPIAQKEITLTICDTNAPTITLDAPGNGSLVRGKTTFTVTATDDYGLSTIVVGDDSRTVSGTSVTESFEIDTTNMEEGSILELNVVAVDTSENVTQKTYTFTIDNVVEPVTELAASVNGESIKLTWTASVDSLVTGYIVERSTDSTSGFVPCDWLSGTTTSYQDTSEFEEGTTYYYRVYAVTGADGAGMSEPAYVSCEYTAGVTPPVIPDEDCPTITTAVTSGVTLCKRAVLSVTASDEVELDRVVFQYESGESWVEIGSVDVSGTAARAGYRWEIPVDLIGEVEIRAVVYDTAGNNTSSEGTVTIQAYTPPAAPVLTATADYMSATLSWTHDGENLKQFAIYETDSRGENRTMVAAVSAASRTWTVAMGAGETGYFVVNAIDSYGTQVPSVVVSVTALATENIAPVAVISPDSLVAAVGQSFTFSGVKSTDNDAIDTYNWDFGDGKVGTGATCAHTYETAGSYNVTLTVIDHSKNTGSVTVPITVYAVDGDEATHTLMTVTVQDGYTENTPVITGATVLVEAEDYSGSALTDNRGQATLLVPKGTVTLSVVKDGYFASVQEVEGSLTVYLRPVGVKILDGKLTTTPMSYEEIVEAKIDVTAPENQHVVKMETTLQFVVAPSMKGTDPILVDLPLSGMFNSVGDFLGGENWGWNSYTESTQTPPSGTGPAKTESSAINIGVFPMGERYILVIYGQAHWLKEMYNVELLVLNNSYAEDITDCVATLELPEGLSLAEMTDRVQTEQVELGTVSKQGQAQANWYVRGDEVGEYNIGASVTGVLGSTPFAQSFTTDQPVKVYAGDALHLTISAQNIAYADEDYKVQYKLENVSDKSLYNLQFGLTGAAEFQAIMGFNQGQMGEWKKELTQADFADDAMVTVEEFKPGDVLTIDFTTDVWFDSLLGNLVELGPLDIGYYVTNVVVTALEGSTTEIPYTIQLVKTGNGQVEEYTWEKIGESAGDTVKDTMVDVVKDQLAENSTAASNSIKALSFMYKAAEWMGQLTKNMAATVVITAGEGAEIGEHFVTLPKKEESIFPYGLRAAQPVVRIYTDADPSDCTMNDDGTMTITGDAHIFVESLREGEAQVTLTTYTHTGGENFRENTYQYTYNVTAQEQKAQVEKVALQGKDTENLTIPKTGETTLTIPAMLIDQDGAFYSDMEGAVWAVTGENTTGVTIVDGVLTVNSMAKAGSYTVTLTADGASDSMTVILTAEPQEPSDDPDTGKDDTDDDNTSSGGNSKPSKPSGSTGSQEKPTDSTVTVETKDDGTVITTQKHQDGTKVETVTDPKGEVSAQIRVPDKVDQVKVEIPVENPASGLVAVIVRPDGTEEIVKTSVTTQQGVSLTVSENAAVKLVDRSKVFEDVHPINHWAKSAVDFAVARDLFSGTSETTFSPDVGMTRGMLAMVLYKLEGQPDYLSTNTFSDVDAEQWYAGAVQWAAGNGIVSGYGNGMYGPNDLITREQLAVILWKYAKSKNLDVASDHVEDCLNYADNLEISAYARDAMEWACENKILSGKQGGILDPGGQALRGEVAQMLWNFMSAM